MNLYRKGDFVAQYNFELCVGASLQMALNMATDDSRTIPNGSAAALGDGP